uniref:Uncharacterized protein n=1 Tax=Anguilla anguilla TaxID=7936 RepID=A0A0E9PMR2_ANGAN
MSMRLINYIISGAKLGNVMLLNT